MAKTVKTAAIKRRETKLSKKSADELIQIVLRKDKTEKNLSSQIVNLKSEVNELSTRVKNFDSDMEGTIQSLETYKDKCKTLHEQNDALKLESNEYKALYEDENETNVKLHSKLKVYKFITFVAIIIAITAIIITVF